MRLVPTTEISTRLLTAADEHQLAQSQLMVGGNLAHQNLTGAVLEACVALMDNYLVFLTDDIPHEDSLHIHRLDEHFTLQESLSIGTAYCTGSFVLRALRAPAQVEFNFLGEGNWCLTLVPELSIHVPFFSDPLGVRRPACVRTRMKLKEPLKNYLTRPDGVEFAKKMLIYYV